MEKIGHIEITITGSKGNIKLSPDNYDIKEIKNILEQAENLLFPSEKKERPVISYNIEEGSVKHIFKTSLQVIIGFNAVFRSNCTNSKYRFSWKLILLKQLKHSRKMR